MPRLVLFSLAAAALPTPAAALDVRPDPVYAASSPMGAILLALAAIAAGIWFIRRRRDR